MALVFVTSSVLLVVLLVAFFGSQVSYAYLYTDLDTRDAAAIAEKLTSLQVPHKIEAEGTAIKVPQDQVHALRLQMAQNGLPTGGSVGNEIFDAARIGATEFEQQVNLRRALEGELARSIATIEGVERARVHLVLPKRRIFANKTKGASASVIVKLRNRHNFGRKEVASIVHLVATAVPNLTEDRVAVVDSKGITLHRPDQDGKAGAVYGQEGGTHEAELAIENRVRTLLERTTGPGTVDVRVTLDLDASTRERTEEHYNPTKTAIRSEHKTEELTGLDERTVAGVPGAQTNLPDVQPTVGPAENAGEGNIARRSHTRNWEIDRVVEKILRPAGTVERMSVAVLLDGRYEMKDGQEIYTPRSAEELEALTQAVQAAVGFDEERGDKIDLRNMRFDRPQVDEADMVEVKPPIWRKYIPYAAAVAGALFVLSVLLLLWRRRKKDDYRKQALVNEETAREEELRLAAAEARLLEEAEMDVGASLDPALALQRRTEALEIATSDPATAAIVLKEWLNTGEDQGATNG